MENENLNVNNSSNNKMIITIILIVVALIIAFLVLFKSNLFDSKEKIEEKEEEKEVIVTPKQGAKLITDDCISYSSDYSCSKTSSKIIDGKEFKVDSVSNSNYEFYYDNNKISSLNIKVSNNEEYTSIEKIYNLNDAIIIFYHQGTDIRGVSIYAFNLTSGSEYLKTKALDNAYPNMVISSLIAEDSNNVYIENDILYIKGSRLTHGGCIDSVLDDVCEDDIDENEVVFGTYKVVMKDDKLEIEKVSYVELKDTNIQWNN